jgi:peptidyl-tRNA hydrolase, PTH2 family
MSDHNIDRNSPEEIEKRKSQEDPIVMYLVVHEIGMSAGKIGAQCGHATGMLHIKQSQQERAFFLEHQHDDQEPVQPANLKMWDDWQNNSFRKVTLTANDAKWAKLKATLSELGIEYSLVIDAGLTQIPSGSETVIGVWPMHKSQRPQILKRLQALE